MFKHTAYLNIVRVRFDFRKSMSKKGADSCQGTAAVVLRFPQADGTYAKYGPYNTPIRTNRTVWDARRSVRPKVDIADDVRELRRQMSAYQADVEAAHAELSRQIYSDETPALVIDGPSVLDMMKRMQLGELSPISLQEVYSQFFAAKKAVLQPNRKIRRQGQISLGTLKTYPKRWTLIQQFLAYQKRPKFPVASVSFRFATELKEWLEQQPRSRRASGTYDRVTIHKVVGLLKMLMVYAQSKEYIKVNTLASFSVKGASNPADPKPLTFEQMDQLETCELPPVLRFQCDSWLVAAELCFHYADYCELPQMKFTHMESGVLMVQHNRAKQTGTNLVQTVNVTPRAERILAKYDGPKGLYYPSNAYWSKILKQIARLADLRGPDGEIIPLQFGQGRDTGLTQRAIDGANGIQLSRIAGWSKPVYAERYIGSPLEIVEAFAQKTATRANLRIG